MSENPMWLEQIRKAHGTFSWEGQALQYDQNGPPAEIVYRRFHDGQATWIDTLLAYDGNGRLAGILNHYPYGGWGSSTGKQLEAPGNVNTFVHSDADPHQAAVIRTLLYREARRRWPHCNDEIFPEKEVAAVSGEDGNRRMSATRNLNR